MNCLNDHMFHFGLVEGFNYHITVPVYLDNIRNTKSDVKGMNLYLWIDHLKILLESVNLKHPNLIHKEILTIKVGLYDNIEISQDESSYTYPCQSHGTI